MLFNTFTYGFFLVLVFCVYLRLPLRARQVFLLVASYVFYCWEKPIYGTLLALSTVLDYTCGLALSHVENRAGRRLILTASLTGNLTLLGFFKYGDFFIHNAVGLGHLLGFEVPWKPMGIILPVGISFYTFQTMSYAIQVYWRQIPATRDFVGFALFVTFFPQLVAGPIERASHLLPQLLVYQRVTLEDITAGLTRIIFGLFRKMVMADRFSILADAVFARPGDYSALTVWTAVFAFGGQIYFDFSGYSDIAIGSARLFGIHIMENFRRPTLAFSIADFWNRWHISLTGWLRDYLFKPLGGYRRGGGRALFNGAVVLLLCGLWHGASWHFVLWGAYHAALMSLYYLWRTLRKRMGWAAVTRQIGPRMILSIAFTYVCTSLSCILFRAPSLAAVGQILRGMVGQHTPDALPDQWLLGVFWAMIGGYIVVEFAQEYLDLNARARRLPWWVRTAGLAALAGLVLLAAVNNNTPYIYFQF